MSNVAADGTAGGSSTVRRTGLSDAVIEPAAPLPAAETAAPGVARPPHLLWALGLGALAIGIALAVGALLARYPFRFDRILLLSLRDPGDLGHPVGPDWLRELMIDFTALGGVSVLTTVVALTLGLLVVRRLWLTAGLVLAATLAGSILSGQAKLLFARPRPALVDHLVEVRGLSFPSGHATNSAIIYLTLALLVSQIVTGRRTRAYILGVAVLLTGIIGISRVYLGVHWPSDVLAGWSIGTCWALAWWWLGAWLRHRIGGGASGTR